MQRADERQVDIRTERPLCGPRFMAKARADTEAHERGHYDVSATFWKTGPVVSAYESWRKFDPEGRLTVSEVVEELTNPLWQQLNQLQMKWDARSVLRVPCEFAQP